MDEAHERNIRDIVHLLNCTGPDEPAERERLLRLLIGIHAGALTPASEDEKRGMERVLAILERKSAEGGSEAGRPYFRGRWSAFQECAIMLRSALNAASKTTHVSDVA